MATVLMMHSPFGVGEQIDVVLRACATFTPAPAVKTVVVREDSSVVADGLTAGRYWLSDGVVQVAVVAKDGVVVPDVVTPPALSRPAVKSESTVVSGARSTANTRVKEPAKRSRSRRKTAG